MDPKVKASESSMLLRLPLEIRRQIYQLALVGLEFRSPSAEAIYLSRLPNDWKDPPSPLLLVNNQVHNEIVELIQRYPITLRVTHQGSHFDGLAETCFIAQRLSRDYSKIPHLYIDIWPPHPDRPLDMINIWRHLRKIRTKLRDLPLLKRVSFFFRDNKLATWTHDGKAHNLLDFPVSCSWESYDVTYIMDLFARVRAEKSCFHMPCGLIPGEKTDYIRDCLESTNAMMMGCISIDENVYGEEDEGQAKTQDNVDESSKFHLQLRGAHIAVEKLDAMTFNGRRRLNPIEWHHFMELWSPRLGIRYNHDFGDKFCDEFKNEDAWIEHYVYRPNYYDSDYYYQ